MQKFNLILFVMLFLSFSLNAQGNGWKTNSDGTKQKVVEGKKATTPEDDPAAVIPDGWKKGGEGIINFSNTSFGDWTSGALNSTAVTGNLALFADYKMGKWLWENDGRFTMGFISTEGVRDWRKADDVIDIDSKLGYQINDKLYWSTLATFDSQFAPTRYYTADTIATYDYDAPVVSRFAAPAIFTLGTGFDYKPTDFISIYFSPLTFKGIYVGDPLAAAFGTFGNVGGDVDTIGTLGMINGPADTLTNNRFKEFVVKEEGTAFKPELGAKFIMGIKRDIIKNISWTSNLELFSNYLENKFGDVKPQNLDVSWVNNFGFTVNRFIKASFETTLLYDDEIDVVKNRGKSDEYVGKGLQNKTFFGVGFTYKFGGGQ